MKVDKLKEMIRNLIEEIENEEEVDEATTTGAVDGYKTPHAFSSKDGEKKKNKRMADIVGYTQVNEDKSGKDNQALWQYLNGHLYYTNPNHKSIYDTLIPKLVNSKNEITEATTPTVIISKKDYDTLQNTNKLVISKLSTGFRHSPNPKYYTQFPKNLKQIYIKNPITKSNELVDVTEVEHEPQGIYIHIKKSKNEVNEATNRYHQLRKEEGTPNQKIGKGIREMRKQLQEIEKFIEWYSKIKTENGLDSSQYWKRTQKHLNVIRERLNKISQKIQNLSV
jgi:hypothetical protein